MCFSEREKCAVLNEHYEMLDKEFNRRRLYASRKESNQMNKVLLEKIQVLSYTAIEKRGEEDNKKSREDLSKYYTAGEDLGESLDGLLGVLCDNCTQKVKVEEFFSINGLQLKRHLPLITGYFLQEGIENINTEGKSYQKIVRFAAFWVFEMDILLREQGEKEEKERRKKLLDQLCREAVEENQKNGNNMKGEKERDAVAVINEYIKMIKRYFPQYIQGKERSLLEEENKIYDDIPRGLS